MKNTLDVVIPDLNEERARAGSVHTLAEFLSELLEQRDWAIVIADNGSTDPFRPVRPAESRGRRRR